MPRTLCTFPARHSERHSPLYVSNTARENVREQDESEFTVRVLTAATVVRVPGLPVNAPASPVVTLMSLDPGVLVVTLSFHDKFEDQVACHASVGNVSTESVVEIVWLSVNVPP